MKFRWPWATKIKTERDFGQFHSLDSYGFPWKWCQKCDTMTPKAALINICPECDRPLRKLFIKKGKK